MKYLKQAYERLIKGGFISRDSLSDSQRAIFRDIDDHRADYSDYLSKIGLILEEGDGYYYLSRSENKVDMIKKLERYAHWIDVLDFVKAWDPAFGPGYQFTKSGLLLKIDADIELKDKARTLYENKEKHLEIAERLTDEMTRQGFIELLDEVSERYQVANAFRYLEELVEMLTFEETDDEIPE